MVSFVIGLCAGTACGAALSDGASHGHQASLRDPAEGTGGTIVSCNGFTYNPITMALNGYSLLSSTVYILTITSLCKQWGYIVSSVTAGV